MTVGELEYYINSNTYISVIDCNGDEIARYNGKDTLDEVSYKSVCSIWAEGDKIIIETEFF